jgi:hypothetical protein
MRKDGFRDEFNAVPVALATPSGRIVSFEKSAPIISGRRGNDPDLDIGLVRFTPEIWSEHQDCAFLSASDCERDHQDDRSGQSFYLVIGYPGSRKMTKIERGQIRQRSACIATVPALQERYTNLNIVAKNQLLLEYDEQKRQLPGSPLPPARFSWYQRRGCVPCPKGNQQGTACRNRYRVSQGARADTGYADRLILLAFCCGQCLAGTTSIAKNEAPRL